MAVRKVLVLPDPRLSVPALPLDHVDDVARQVAEDLLDTMRASPACVGLAAPQIGIGLRIFTLDVSGHRKARSCHGPFVLCNPEVTSTEGVELAREGCMSVPDLTGDVARAERLTVAGTGVDGERRSFDFDGFEARAVLHEIDHLDGLLFLDRVNGPHALFQRKVYR
jgi:peptide deformylase